MAGLARRFPITAVLYAFLPVALWAHHTGNGTLTFVASALAIVPLAGLLGNATEALAARAGAGVGGLLNAALGNAAELIIGLLALKAGHIDLVKASITGSIIGNLLVVIGLAYLLGGWGREKQSFSAVAAEQGAGLLFVSVAGLAVPSILGRTGSGIEQNEMLAVSTLIAGVLFAVYVAGLLFSMRTHRHLFDEEQTREYEHHWPRRKIALALLVSAGGIALLAEFLVGSIESATHAMGLSPTFTGVIIVALVGNAAEHATAVVMARKDRMNLAMNIAMESSKQVALFVAPVLVFAGLLFSQPMTLEFTVIEEVALGLSVVTVTILALNGESNWLEGVQLLALYAILGVAFYFGT